MLTTGSILAAGGAKAMYDYLKVLPNLIYGYILKELNEKNVIDSNLSSDCISKSSFILLPSTSRH